MKISEQDSSSAESSYQCNFVLLPRKEKIKNVDDISGQESAEGCSSAETKS